MKLEHLSGGKLFHQDMPETGELELGGRGGKAALKAKTVHAEVKEHAILP